MVSPTMHPRLGCVALAAIGVAACGLDLVGTRDDGAAAGPTSTAPGGGSSSSGSSTPVVDAGGPDAPSDGGSSSGDAAVASITYSRAAAPSTANLTTEGTGDWAFWGSGAPTERKSGVSHVLADYAISGNPTSTSPSNNDPTTFTWQDGTNNTNESGTTDHFFLKGTIGAAATFLVDAKSSAHTAIFYIGLNRARARFEVDFTDGSVPVQSEEPEKNDGALAFRYAITFATPAAGVKLRVKWTLLTTPDLANSTVRICAATYQ
jgi:hypothetical protein